MTSVDNARLLIQLGFIWSSIIVRKILFPIKKNKLVPVFVLCFVLDGPRCQKTSLRGFANNTGADQPAHLRSLIRALVIRFLEGSICKLATGEISIF